MTSRNDELRNSSVGNQSDFAPSHVVLFKGPWFHLQLRVPPPGSGGLIAQLVSTPNNRKARGSSPRVTFFQQKPGGWPQAAGSWAGRPGKSGGLIARAYG